MGIILRKNKSEFRFTTIGRLSIIAFIGSLAFAMVSTIWALYLDSFLHSIVLVGFFSAFLTLLSFLSFFGLVPFIEKTSKSKIYAYSTLLFAITYILFAINTKFYFFVILAFIVTILSTLRITSIGIIIKDKSSKKLLSRNEGLFYTFTNVSWLLGPLIAGLVAEKYGISMIFILSSIFIFLSFLLFKFSKIQDANIQKKQKTNITKNFIDFFKNKDRIIVYILSGGISLWWTLIYIFIPLFIIRNNLHEMWVGYFLSAIVVPLVLFEYFFGKLAGKIGFRKLFKIGYLIPCVLAITCFFVGNIYIILALLVLASLGMSMVESTTEAYFFDISSKKDELKFYGPYNTAIDVNYFIGKILASTILIFFPFKSIFLLFGALMFVLFILSFKTKNIIESKK